MLTTQTRLLALALVLVLIGCQEKKDSSMMPQPTDGTIVKMDMEEGNKKSERMAWFDLMHKTDEGVDWRDVEHDNMIRNQALQSRMKDLDTDRDGIEAVAEGKLEGTWNERGASNIAGNLRITQYDAQAQELFAISDGGTLWKGHLGGLGWQVVHQGYQFSPNLLEITYLEDGTRRIISSVRNHPCYSDDGGENWTFTNLNSDNWSSLYGTSTFKNEATNSDELLFLHREAWGQSIALYRADTKDMEFEQLRSFATSDTRNVNMSQVYGTNLIYVIEQRTDSTSRIFKYNPETVNFDVIKQKSRISSGDNGRINIDAVMVNDTVILYSYDDEKNLYKSMDEGESWEFVSNLPVTPWGVGLFVSHSDPDQMFIGAVNCYRSNNGGENWQIVNEWWEYYGQEDTKLHADIMYFEEYFDENNEPFILINNHGGIHRTNNYGKDNMNISLYGLNTAQYYDVSTYPADPNYVFAGSQDQGIQRGILGESDHIADFHQIVSGDYGHSVFTQNGTNMYTVYPSGSISFYENPTTSGPIAGYEIASMNESSAWIVPMMEDPAPDNDIAYAAGGSVDGGAGSYLIKLNYEFGELTAENMPFDFVEYGTITSMGYSPLNNDYWYVGTDMGRFLYSTDRGQSFQMSNDFVTTGHYLYGAGITASRIDPEVVYFAGSGYNGPGVYKSTNHGQTFTPMGDGLPNTLVFNIALNEDETLIYAATEAGPYVYIVQEGEWYSLHGEATPNQTYWSVEYLPEMKTARFGTYGRGIWDFVLSQDLVSTKDLAIDRESMIIYPNPVQDMVQIKLEKSGAFQYEVLDMAGRVWKKGNVENHGDHISLDMSELSAGQFIIRLTDKETQYISKFVKI